MLVIGRGRPRCSVVGVHLSFIDDSEKKKKNTNRNAQFCRAGKQQYKNKIPSTTGENMISCEIKTIPRTIPRIRPRCSMVGINLYFIDDTEKTTNTKLNAQFCRAGKQQYKNKIP